MDDKKVLEVIAIYRKKFEEEGTGQIDYPHKKLLPGNAVARHVSAAAHCHGMLNEMEEFVRDGRMDKAFRWLGFIQGVLWVLRLYTIEELKNHNRPAE